MREVRKSSQDCAKFNADNAAMIELGMMEGITPNKEIVEGEARMKKAEEEKRKQNADMVKVLKQVFDVLPDYCKKRYIDPAEKHQTFYNGVGFSQTPNYDFYTPNLEIERFRSDTTGERYNRAVVGYYGDKKMVKLKNSIVTKDEVTRILRNIIDACDVADTKAAKERLAKMAAERKKDYAANHPDFMKTMGIDIYSNWEIEDDGRITIHYQHSGLGSTHSFTALQWLEYEKMRAEYLAQRKALVDRFESTNKAAT